MGHYFRSLGSALMWAQGEDVEFSVLLNVRITEPFYWHLSPFSSSLKSECSDEGGARTQHFLEAALKTLLLPVKVGVGANKMGGRKGRRKEQKHVLRFILRGEDWPHYQCLLVPTSFATGEDSLWYCESHKNCSMVRVMEERPEEAIGEVQLRFQ